MASTTNAGFGVREQSALAALKPHDGEGHKAGFKAYVEAHKGAWPDDVTAATLRREAAARELLGLSTAAYAERSERCVRALLARCPSVSAAIAFSFVSHKALAEGRAKAARRAELLRAVRKVTEAVEAALFRAATSAAEAPKPAPVSVVQVVAPKPANDVTAPPPPAAPGAPAKRARKARAACACVGPEGLRCKLSGGHSGRHVALGGSHWAPEPAPPARWPGRDDYPAYACGG